MAAEQQTVVQIESDADVDQLIARLPEMKRQHVVISVNDDSSTMLTAAEYSRILSAARDAHATLAISTDDHLRRELARMLGWAVVGRKRSASPHEGSEPRTDPAGPVDHEHTTADLATYAPADGGTKTSSDQRPATDTGTVVVDSGAPPAHEPVPGPSFPLPAAARRLSESRRARSSEPPVTATSGARRKALLAAAIVAPLVVLAIVAGIIFYVLPTATVTVVPTENAIAADLTYGLASADAKYDITVDPVPVSNTAVFDKTIPTTGERFEPDGTAAGQVLFTNPNTKPITVPVHTPLAGSNGLTYFTQDAVAVPASDPYGSLSFGSATVGVAAEKPGPDGNTKAGTVVGQLDTGVFYTNRAAISGGTTKRISVVSQADLDALKQQAEQDLAARAEKEFNATIKDPMVLVPSSMQVEPPALEFNRKAGEDATDVSVHGTQAVKGMEFDPSKLHAQARDEAGRRLASQAGGGVILLGPSVKISEPKPLNDAQTAFSIHASGTVRSVITDEERRQLAASLVGKDMTAADRIVADMPDIAQYRIDERPTWMPKRMPQLASHIQIQVASGEQLNAQP